MHDALARRGLRPGEHAADSGYASADLLLAARARGITLLAPVPPDSSPQARSGGYTADMFTIDWENKQVTCPQGAGIQFLDPGPQQGDQHHPGPVRQGDLRTVPGPGPVHHRGPLRPPARLPSPPDPRGPHRRPRRAGRRRLAARYRIRAGVEGTIAQATHVTGIRRARYLGLGKTRLEHNTAAAAINLIRLDAWWTGKPLDRTRTTHLQRLDLAA